MRECEVGCEIVGGTWQQLQWHRAPALNRTDSARAGAPGADDGQPGAGAQPPSADAGDEGDRTDEAGAAAAPPEGDAEPGALAEAEPATEGAEEEDADMADAQPERGAAAAHDRAGQRAPRGEPTLNGLELAPRGGRAAGARAPGRCAARARERRPARARRRPAA